MYKRQVGQHTVDCATGMRRRSFADIPQEIIARFYALKWELHQDLVRLSDQGMLIRAEQSDHDIRCV